MSNYFIGGWTQDLKTQPPASFLYTMYGMITNLPKLTIGPPGSTGGWGPATTPAPSVPGKVLWTYGGGGAGPQNMPQTTDDINAIINATNNQHWSGVDFDDESSFDIDNVVNTMKGLGGLEKSYTFLAGWAYCNPDQSPEGKAINDAVKQVAMSGACDRFVLMCYSDTMWTTAEIEQYVPASIQQTINNTGDSKKVVLALTTKGLDSDNLNFFLKQVTDNNLGGLFIWDFVDLSSEYLNTIETTLGIPPS